jgi:hypothetical protein
VSGPPSVANFCTLLIADYRHINSLPSARNLQTTVQITYDWAREIPQVVAEAPPDIAAAARTYLTTVGGVLSQLASDRLHSSKVPTKQLVATLTNPSVVAAGNQLFAFSTEDCHYDLATRTST